MVRYTTDAAVWPVVEKRRSILFAALRYISVDFCNFQLLVDKLEFYC